MSARRTRNAQIIFSLMVPLTITAFVFGSVAESTIELKAPDMFDVMSIVSVGIGVWLYNWFEEKPQKASIETLQ